jgi:hypothetical protein
MVEQRKSQIRRRGGRFYGFRINCEQVPILPAWAVHWVWDDPRRIPYLLVWKSSRDGKVEEAVRVGRFAVKTRFQEADAVEARRTDGSAVSIYLVWRRQPHGGRSLLLRCWRCQKPSRALYGAKVGDDGRFYIARRADWECRTCAKLRYSSEGGNLQPGMQFRAFGNLPRPELWLPYVFTSPQEASRAGFCTYT